MEFREAIAAALAAVPAWEGRFSADEVAAMLETPPNPDLGDFAFPCFKLAKTLRKAPPLIAQEAAAALALPEGVSRAEAAGGYVNFTATATAAATWAPGATCASTIRRSTSPSRCTSGICPAP